LQRLDTSLWRGLVSNVQPEFDVVTAPTEVVTDGGEPEKLIKVMRFARHHYEWVVADLGSGMSRVTLRLAGELGALFVVACAEVPVLYQTRRVLQKLVSLGYPQRRIRLVLNRHHRQRQVRGEEVKQALGWDIAAILPNDLVETEQALAEKRLISRRCELARRIGQLATRFRAEQSEEPEELPLPVSFAPAPAKALQRVR
jgi:pilus assembly protein CpaE